MIFNRFKNNGCENMKATNDEFDVAKISDITRLYMQRCDGARGFLSAGQQYKKAIINLAHDIKNKKDK